jgi:hypothetical protein
LDHRQKSIFVVFRVTNAAALEAALKNVFPENYLIVGNGEYLVSAIGSAKDVSDRLGISSGPVGPAIVFKMSNYFGRASTDIWEWIKVKAEQTGG